MPPKKLCAEDKEWVREIVAELVSDSLTSNIQVAITNAITPLQSLLEQTCAKLNSMELKLEEKNTKIRELEETNASFQEKIASFQEKFVSAMQRNIELHSLIHDKCAALEQYQRKSSLRISGIPILENEDNDSLKTQVVNKLSEHGVGIGDIGNSTCIDRANPFL